MQILIGIQCLAFRWEQFFAEISSCTALIRHLGMKTNSLHRIYENNYVLIFFMMIAFPYNIIQKKLTKTRVVLKPNFMSSCSYAMYLLIKCEFSTIIFLNQNLHDKDFKIFYFHTVGYTVFIHVWHVKAVQDDISANTFPIWYWYNHLTCNHKKRILPRRDLKLLHCRPLSKFLQ